MRPPSKLLRRRDLLTSLAVASLTGVSACDPNKPQFVSIDITGADYARSFRLPDQQGQVRTLNDFKGKVVAVFFGYTQCPDVCPTTLTEWVEIKRQLGADGDRLQGLFITVDPARDTPEELKAYMGNFVPSFLALIPDHPDALAHVAKEFTIIYNTRDGKTQGSYTPHIYTHDALRT